MDRVPRLPSRRLLAQVATDFRFQFGQIGEGVGPSEQLVTGIRVSREEKELLRLEMGAIYRRALINNIKFGGKCRNLLGVCLLFNVSRKSDLLPQSPGNPVR